ncbi:MAG TPA: hypothetical protein VIW07_18050 [Candidatus Udaeobacter sp.]|jgi:hypothetical protein
MASVGRKIAVAVALLSGLPYLSILGASGAVTFLSECKISGNHGVDRWTAKTDPQRMPADRSQIAEVTPSQMARWPGVGREAGLTRKSKRIPSEQRWFALTGLVEDIRVEADGDIHLALIDARGHKPGIVGVEIPPGPMWCEFRKLIFSWTTTKFPFRFKSSKVLTLVGRHVTTVTGKAFYDIDHAPKDRSNQRPHPPFAVGYAVWEIHPVMTITW